MNKKIVIASPSKKYAENWAKIIRENDNEFQVEIYPDDTNREETEFILSFLPEENLFSHYPNLKVVGSLGAGVHSILRTPSLPKEVVVTKIAQKEHQQDMAEFVLGLILNHTRCLFSYSQYKAEKNWQPRSYKSAPDTTVGIMGIGAIGQVIAELLLKVGFPVSGWSKSKKDLPDITTFYGEGQRDDFLKTADILVCVLPLTDETTGILNTDIFEKLSAGAYVINVGRGMELVDEDLIQALDSGHLSGAALDVFQEEPLPENHPFWAHPKIMITPHTAGNTHPAKAVKDILRNYKAMKNGEPLIHTIDRKKGY